MDKAGEGFPAIKSLADLCKNYITATAICFTKYADDPEAVIVICKNRVDFCFLSHCLKDLHGLSP